MYRLLLALNRTLRWILVLVAAFFIWQVWVFARPKQPPYTETQLQAVRQACRQVAGRIATQDGGALRFGLAHFSGDNNGAVTRAMREELARHDAWRLCDESPIRKFLGDVTHAVSNASSLDEVIHAGRAVEMDVVLAGRVIAVTQSNDSGRALLKVWAYDSRSNRWLVNQEIEGVWRPSLLARATSAIQHWDWRGRLLLWLGFVGLLPWLTLFGTRWAITRRSNAVSFGLLAIYTLSDLLLAVALAGFVVAGGWAWTQFFVTLLLCSAYNFWACERIAVREK